MISLQLTVAIFRLLLGSARANALRKRRNRPKSTPAHPGDCNSSLEGRVWFSGGIRLCRSSRRPVQQRFRQHRLAFVPAFSAVYEPVGPIRSRVWRPFCAALFRLRRHYRKDERNWRNTGNGSRVRAICGVSLDEIRLLGLIDYPARRGVDRPYRRTGIMYLGIDLGTSAVKTILVDDASAWSQARAGR